MNINLEIPVRAYLKKFISKTRDVEHFTLKNKKCYYSRIILEHIQKWQSKDVDRSFSHLNDRLTIAMTGQIVKENRFSITEEAILVIDSRLQALFNQQLVDFVEMSTEKHGDMLAWIDRFLAYYEIDEDLCKREAIVKMYYRYRFPQQPKPKPKEIKVAPQATLF